MWKFIRDLFSKPKREYDYVILSISASPYNNTCSYVAMDQKTGEIQRRVIHGTQNIDKESLIKTLNNGGTPGIKF